MSTQLSEARYYLLSLLDRVLYGSGRSRRVPESLFASKQRAYLDGIRLAVEANERASERLASAISEFGEFIYGNVRAEEVSIDDLRALIDDSRAPLEYWAWKAGSEETKRYALHFAGWIDERFEYIERNWSEIEEHGGYISETVRSPRSESS